MLSANLVRWIERLEGRSNAFPRIALAFWSDRQPRLIKIDDQSIAVPGDENPHEFATRYVNDRSAETVIVALVRSVSGIDCRHHADQE